MPKHVYGNTTRASRILKARAKGPQATEAAEHEVTICIVGPEVMAVDAAVRKECYPQYGYMTAFEATEVLAQELQEAMATYASNERVKHPTSATYSPLYSTPTMFSDVWRLRQVLDELGMSYWFFAQHATMYWAAKRRKRVPRPLQLCTPAVINHVMGLWSDPEFRYATPIFDGWDKRFDTERYVGDAVQVAGRKLIDQRVEDAITLRHNPAHALAPFIGTVLSEPEATARYGEALVLEARAYDPMAGLGAELAL